MIKQATHGFHNTQKQYCNKSINFVCALGHIIIMQVEHPVHILGMNFCPNF